MRTLCEQYLSKGPRALYHVALRERDDHRCEIVCRWDNPKSADVLAHPVADEVRGKQLFENKLAELADRGYEKRDGPVRMREPQPQAPPAVTAPQIAHTLSAEPDPPTLEPLAAVLERRRREAAWSLD